MASCRARTLGKPRAAAALLSPPNWRASAETLLPKQLAFPGVPANTGVAGWANAHVAPARLLSPGPPTMAVFPSPESDTETPCTALPTAPVPTSLACWLHTLPERVYTHVAPA